MGAPGGSATAISPMEVGTELILPFLSREWAPAYLPGSSKEQSGAEVFYSHIYYCPKNVLLGDTWFCSLLEELNL